DELDRPVLGVVGPRRRREGEEAETQEDPARRVPHDRTRGREGGGHFTIWHFGSAAANSFTPASVTFVPVSASAVSPFSGASSFRPASVTPASASRLSTVSFLSAASSFSPASVTFGARASVSEVSFVRAASSFTPASVSPGPAVRLRLVRSVSPASAL